MTNRQLEVRGAARGEHTWIFTLSGNLHGGFEGYGLQEEVRKKIASGVQGIVVDLAAVEGIDSSGIGILVGSMVSASRSGTKFILASISPRVEKILSIVKLLDHIDHEDSVDKALARLDTS